MLSSGGYGHVTVPLLKQVIEIVGPSQHLFLFLSWCLLPGIGNTQTDLRTCIPSGVLALLPCPNKNILCSILWRFSSTRRRQACSTALYTPQHHHLQQQQKHPQRKLSALLPASHHQPESYLFHCTSGRCLRSLQEICTTGQAACEPKCRPFVVPGSLKRAAKVLLLLLLPPISARATSSMVKRVAVEATAAT